MYLITIIHFSGTKLPIQLVPPSAHGTSPALRHSSRTWAIPVEWGFHGKATMNDPWSISRVMFIIHYVYMEGTPIYGKIYSHLWKSSCEILTSTIVFYLKTILFYISEVLYRVLFHDKSEITVTNQNKIWAAKHEGVVTSNQEFGIMGLGGQRIEFYSGEGGTILTFTILSSIFLESNVEGWLHGCVCDCRVVPRTVFSCSYHLYLILPPAYGFQIVTASHQRCTCKPNGSQWSKTNLHTRVGTKVNQNTT